MRAGVALVAAALAIATQARGATFNIGGFAGNIPIIDVSGQIVDHDDEKFALFANALQFAVVRLDSRGGQAAPALSMGQMIHDKGFSTYVSPGHLCASACGLIWLAGAPRAKDESAMVGFHGIFLTVDGQSQQTAPGNAFVGVYLDHLHFDTKAIYFATVAQPNQMSWLTPETGRDFDITYDTRSEVETTLWQKPAVVTTTSSAPLTPVAPPMQLQGPIPLVNPAPLPPPVKSAHKPLPHVKAAERPRTLQDDVTEFFFGRPSTEQQPSTHRTSAPVANAPTPTE